MKSTDCLTKIVGTIGPATSNPETIKKLIAKGLDVIRINFSHGDRNELIERIKLIREINPTIAILQDLCGPKIRVGTLEDNQVVLQEGGKCLITTEDIVGTEKLIPTSYHHLCSDVSKGDRILLDDGKLELIVIGINDTTVECSIIEGGILKSKKGMNFPDTTLTISSITEKDILDLQAALQVGVDFIALSFVRSHEDIVKLKKLISQYTPEDYNDGVRIIAKIERPEAVQNLCAILDHADGVMVARGDLGIEMPMEKVTILQKEIIHKANERVRYVITATQMLESMITQSLPTRAEVSDVSNAILDGSGAVMLSGETAVGKYPSQCIDMMNAIGRQTEQFMRDHEKEWRVQEIKPERLKHDAIGHAVFCLYSNLKAKAIIAYSATGGTALYLSKHRPLIPIVVYSDSIATCRRMRLVWGIFPVYCENIKSKSDLKEYGGRYLLEQEIADKGDSFLVIAGDDFGVEGSGNLIEINQV